MIDKEKVIKGLKICVNRVPGKYDCNECPYEIDGNCCEINLAKDVLALLEEHESVKEDPITVQRVYSNRNTHKDYFKIIFRSDNFAELLSTMHENGKTITNFWHDFDICTMQNKFVLEFDELKKEIEKNDAANKPAKDA